MIKALFRCCAIVLLVIAGQSLLLSQENRGSILGQITDPAKSAVVGATVRAVNVDTSIPTPTRTDASGSYNIPFLPPGTYRVEVEAAGFSNAVNPSVILHAQETRRLDFAMQVGNLQQAVSVTAEAPMLQTASTNSGETVNTISIQELPTLSRNLASLANIGPGMQTSQNGISNTLSNILTGGISITANGIRDSANQYTIDGANVNVGLYNYPSFVPVPDAVQEFAVQSGSYSADYGQFAGAHIDYTLKSGTNSFHGSAWEFFQNDALNARNFFSPSVPLLRHNQFGGLLGGPIKRNKTFFMVSYQGLRHNSVTFALNVVPTAAQRNGDLSLNTNGTPAAPIVDPSTGQPFPGNIIPVSRISPVSQAALTLLAPLPNQSGSANWAAFVPLPQHYNDTLVKVDHSFSERDILSGRFFIHPYSYYQVTSSVGQFANSAAPSTAKNVALIETHTFSPTIVLASRVSWNRQTLDQLYQQNSSTLDTRQLFGLQIPSSIHPGDPMNTYPYFSITGYGALGELGNSPLYQPDENYQIASDLAVIKGKHALKFGYEFDRYRSSRFVNDNTNGQMNFTPTNPAGSGSAIGDFLLGLPTSTVIALLPITVDLRRTSADLYIADKWTVTPKLTVDLGLRYELDVPTNEHFGRIPVFNLTPPGSFETLARGEKLYQGDLNDFAPRLGVAYRVTNNDVIRAAGGIYYSLTPQLEMTFMASNPPFITSETFTASKASPLTLVNPFPVGLAASGGVPAPTTFQTNQHTPAVNEWLLDMQHNFGQSLLLGIAYVGNHATHFGRTVNLNVPLTPGPGAIQARRPLPNFGPVSYFQFDDNSSYNSLQVRLEKRFTNGLTFLASYTYSKDLDLFSNELGGTTVNPANLNLDYGPSDFDVKHNFTASYVYNLPFGQSRRFLATSGRIVDGVLGGWQLSGVTTVRSGYPITVTYPGDVANVGLGTRPIRTCNGSLGGNASLHEWFDTSCFIAPAQYTYGNSGRGILFGPRLQTWNLALMKSFRTFERQSLQFRAEFYNAFNHVNFSQPNAQVNTPTAAQITSALPARNIQFGLEYHF